MTSSVDGIGTSALLLGDGDAGLAASQRRRQRRAHGQHLVLGEGGLDELGVAALGQQELAVVFAVDAAAIALLFVFGVHLGNTWGSLLRTDPERE